MLIPGATTSGPRDLASPESDSPAPPQIREEIDKFGIHVYQFPECDSDEDEDFKQQDRELKVGREAPGEGLSPGPTQRGQGSLVWAVEPFHLAREG